MNKYIIASVVLHLFIVALLSISMSLNPTHRMEIPQPQGEPIKAVAVDQKLVDAQVKKLKAAEEKKRLAEKKRIEELEKRLKAAENKRKAEEQRLKKLELERKRKQQEKERAEEAARKAKLKQKEEAKRAAKAEADRKRKEAERRKAEDKRKKAEAERKKAEKAAAEAKKKREREEAERKRKEKEAKEQAELDRMMEMELEAENQQIGVQRQAQILSEKNKYIALIKAAIQRHWLVDDLMAGKKCVLGIKLAQDGFVISVDNGKGDPLVCDSARKAVRKAGALPMSADPEVNREMREINLTMEPIL